MGPLLFDPFGLVLVWFWFWFGEEKGWQLIPTAPYFLSLAWLYLVSYCVSSLCSCIVHVLVTMFLVHVLVLFNYSVLKHCAHIRCTHIVCTHSIRSAHVCYLYRHYVPRIVVHYPIVYSLIFVALILSCIHYCYVCPRHSVPRPCAVFFISSRCSS
jgi:hypothetical protein